MIELIIKRDGKAEGFSLLVESPQRFNTWNPYNTFFQPKEEEMEIVKELYRESIKVMDDRYKDLHIPEHTVLTMAYLVHCKNGGTFSFIETACLPGVQSLLMAFIVLLHKRTGANYKINTLSEYMVRCSQVLVAYGIISTDDIKIFDMPNQDSDDLQDISATIKDCHEYENEIGVFRI